MVQTVKNAIRKIPKPYGPGRLGMRPLLLCREISLETWCGKIGGRHARANESKHLFIEEALVGNIAAVNTGDEVQSLILSQSRVHYETGMLDKIVVPGA